MPLHLRQKAARLSTALGVAILALSTAQAQTVPVFQDPAQPLTARVSHLVVRLLLEEKAQQMLDQRPAIPRLGILACSWWNEARYGVARSGPATVFPQAIGLAATFDDDLARREATAIPDGPRYPKVAARAKHYAMHSGPEKLRHEFDAAPSMQDLRETYLPAFKALVQQGRVKAAMCAAWLTKPAKPLRTAASSNGSKA